MKMRLLAFAFLAFLLISGCSSEPPAPSPDDSLSGTWSGGWGTGDRRDSVELQLEWDGTRLEGTVNPRSQGMSIENAAFDAATGNLSLEFDAYDDGRAVRYVVEGKVEGDTMAGTWRRGDQQGDFEVTRKAP
jgi:hypothetical protein